MPKMSLGAPGRVCLNWDERSFRPRLHPPRPTSCVYNNLLPGTSAADVPCDSVHSFPTALRRWRNLAEIDRRAGVGLTRLATGQAKTKNQPRGLLQQPVCRATDPPKSPHWFQCRLKAKETAPNWGSLYLLFEFLNDNLSLSAPQDVSPLRCEPIRHDRKLGLAAVSQPQGQCELERLRVFSRVSRAPEHSA